MRFPARLQACETTWDSVWIEMQTAWQATLKFSRHSADVAKVSETLARRHVRQRGSALLLTLLLTLAGALILGLSVDALSLLWIKSNAQNTANLTAGAVSLERARNPSAPDAYLVETARAAAARNGYRHGTDSVSIHLERENGRDAILVERDTGIFFLRMIRPQPIAIRARAELSTVTVKAGL